MIKSRYLLGIVAGTMLAGGINAASLPVFAKTEKSKPQVTEQKAFKPYKHIFVLMMENHSASNIIGNSNSPFINKLANTYGYDDNYFGVTHPSLPNYIAALSGNTWYSNSDDPTQKFDHKNLMDQLEQKHLTWKGYMQDLPYAGFDGYWYPDNLPSSASPAQTPPNALYGKKHNPFLLFSDIANTPRAKNAVPLDELKADLKSGNVPNFSWISPNMIDDMHGQSPGEGATTTYAQDDELIKDGDQFVKKWVTEIMNSKVWKQGQSLILVTWDEGTYPGSNPSPEVLQKYVQGGPDSPYILPGKLPDGTNWAGGVYGGSNIPFIFINSRQPQHAVLHTWADHYSLLRTVEANWNLDYLGMAGDSNQVQTLDVFGGKKEHEKDKK